MASLHKLLSLMLLGFNNDNKKNWRHDTSMPTPKHLNLGGPRMQILNCTHKEVAINLHRMSVVELASHRNARIHIAEENSDWESSADICFLCTSSDATFLQVEQLIYSHVECIRHLTFKTDTGGALLHYLGRFPGDAVVRAAAPRHAAHQLPVAAYPARPGAVHPAGAPHQDRRCTAHRGHGAAQGT